jgi:hypothetical protein
MKWVRRLLIVLAVYVALVAGFEALVGYMGKRQASRGLDPGDSFLVITTTAEDGSQKDTVVAGVESGGQLYVAANHWPRAWYGRAVEHPDVEITRGGAMASFRAVPVSGDERERIARDYTLPWAIRLLTGFPPRAFLRLDPR